MNEKKRILNIIDKAYSNANLIHSYEQMCEEYEKNQNTHFHELVGKSLKSCCAKKGGDAVIFITTDDEQYKLFHDQDCCEQVLIEDICGDLSDFSCKPRKPCPL